MSCSVTRLFGLMLFATQLFACGAPSTSTIGTGAAPADTLDQLKKKKVTVQVSPSTVQLVVGKTTQFTATVSGSTNTAVVWTATGGTIDATGLFTAGASPGSFVVVAKSVAVSTASAEASITITAATPTAHAIQHVFVVAMENQDAQSIYGNASAPFLNDTVMKKYSFADHYGDDLPTLPSEPHYVYMEAGTNAFSDITFKNDSDPSTSNSTASTDHLVSLGMASWRSYQEDMPAACPVKSVFPYAAKHDPFVFFRDVSFTNGKPDATNTYCAAHHKDASELASDVAAHDVAAYTFITPNLCNDMHGDSRCTNGCTSTAVGNAGCVAAGDAWLASHLPPLIAYAEANAGVIFIVWDEAEATKYAPFFVISSHLAKPGAAVSTAYGHGSLARSVSAITQVPLLSDVIAVPDFSDFFEPGQFP